MIYHGQGLARGVIQFTGRGVGDFYATVRTDTGTADDYASYFSIGY